MSYLAIIGTAGRNEDGDKLTKEHYDYMYQVAKTHNTNKVVSGGAPWADHIAVRLFLRNCVEKLILYLPFEFTDGKFTDEYFNGLHRNFSKKCEIDSLNEIKLAIDKGCKVIYGNKTTDRTKAFHARNTLIAEKCTEMIAFTFNDGDIPKVGGTLDTWNKANCEKIHYPLKN